MRGDLGQRRTGLRPLGVGHRRVHCRIDARSTSVAAANGTVYTLGDKLYSYAEAALTRTAESAVSGTADASQRIRIDGSCAVITGRTLHPQFYTAGNWTTTSTPLAAPAAIRSVATVAGRIYLLTDYSLEILDSAATPKQPSRRHSSRP